MIGTELPLKPFTLSGLIHFTLSHPDEGSAQSEVNLVAHLLAVSRGEPYLLVDGEVRGAFAVADRGTIVADACTDSCTS